MEKINIKTLVVGMVQTNCYIISNSERKEAIVIDPGDDDQKIIQYLESNDLVCKAILLTHGHFDHILASKDLAAAVNAKIYIHEEDAELSRDPNLNASAQISGKAFSLVPDILVKDGEILDLVGQTIRVIHTPGHTSGGACYYFENKDILFSGDTLFRESVGRSDFPTGNGKLLITSIKAKLMILEDITKVYPGHGMPTTIGFERKNNCYIVS